MQAPHTHSLTQCVVILTYHSRAIGQALVQSTKQILDNAASHADFSADAY